MLPALKLMLEYPASLPLSELQSKLLKGGYIGVYIGLGDYYRDYEGCYWEFRCKLV